MVAESRLHSERPCGRRRKRAYIVSAGMNVDHMEI
jgi:hypothetical protein